MLPTPSRREIHLTLRLELVTEASWLALAVAMLATATALLRLLA